MKQSGKSTEGQENKICFQHFRRCQKLCTEAFLELNGHLIFSEQLCKTWGFLLKIKGGVPPSDVQVLLKKFTSL